MRNRMPSIGPDHKIRSKIAFAVRCFCSDPGHAIFVEQKIDHFVLHAKRKRREACRLVSEKIQKIPLRHERDEFAMGWQVREIGDRDRMTIENSANFPQLLVRQLEE